jgi:ADP-heptose:LPS heptosyltransferase
VAQKLLILRFSSIGDIVLTTPVIRACKKQLAATEIHFVCKNAFRSLLEHNPYIHKIHSFEKDIKEIYETLNREKFDVIIDLHNNLRSFRLKRYLGVKSYSFNKLNVLKLTAVVTKKISILPEKHIVNRYLETVLPLGVKDDGQGLDFFIPEEAKNLPKPIVLPQQFSVLVLGGSYFTKKIPINKLREICSRLKFPLVLLGGSDGTAEALELVKEFPNVVNLCGTLSLHQSAFVISQSAWVITPDTGLMHMAAAFNKRIISVWGNTVPEFGMGPYLPQTENKILEVKNLSCRPCSKLGYHKCPKGHFKCMNNIDFSFLDTLKA